MIHILFNLNFIGGIVEISFGFILFNFLLIDPRCGKSIQIIKYELRAQLKNINLS